MRKIATLVAATAAAILLAGCRSASAAGSPGAPSAQAAVEEFLAAARGRSVQAMAGLFGTSAGSIAQRESPNDVEKRMRALQCYLAHDSARVVDDLPSAGDKRQLTVELRQRNVVHRTAFTAVPGPHRRWFVESFDIQAVADLCRP